MIDHYLDILYVNILCINIIFNDHNIVYYTKQINFLIFDISI